MVALGKSTFIYIPSTSRVGVEVEVDIKINEALGIKVGVPLFLVKTLLTSIFLPVKTKL